jgi:hypothetical protein
MDARSGLLAVDGWSWLPMDARPGLAVDVPQGLAVGVRPLTDASGRPFVAGVQRGRSRRIAGTMPVADDAWYI